MAEEVSAQFPPPRLGTELVLIDVDPRRAHAYWNIDVEDYEAARALAGPGDQPLVLRIHDVTGDRPDAESSFDVEVQGLQNHWSIDLWQSGRSYVSEIGLRQPDGSLIGIARSNRVQTPRAAQSPAYDTSALDIADLDLGPVATDLAAAARLPDPAGETVSDPPLMAVLPLPAGLEAPAASVESMEPMLRDRYPEVSSAAPLQPGAGTAPPIEPPYPVGPWPSVEEIVRALPEMQGHLDVFCQAAAPGASVEPSAAGAASAPQPREAERPAQPVAPAPTSLDSYVNLSSFVNGRATVELEVNVELHIYGRAKPGAQLTFHGQRVPLQPDGTFSLRKPLPHGAVVLPLVMHSPPPTDAGESA